MKILSNDKLRLGIDPRGASLAFLGAGSAFIYQMKNLEGKKRGGMHICTPIFGSSKGKGVFKNTPQYGELRDEDWKVGAHFNDRDIRMLTLHNLYQKHGVVLQYVVTYSLFGANLKVTTYVNNIGSFTVPVEIAWKPYFHSPSGAKVLLGSKEYEINEAFGPQIFSAPADVSLLLPGIGRVILSLDDLYRNAYVCIWTDRRDNYICLAPMISYKKFPSTTVVLGVDEEIETKFVMCFEEES